MSKEQTRVREEGVSERERGNSETQGRLFKTATQMKERKSQTVPVTLQLSVRICQKMSWNSFVKGL